MLKKDYLITPEQVQNWQPLHEVLNDMVAAIKELQERVGVSADDETPEPESEKEDASPHPGTSGSKKSAASTD